MIKPHQITAEIVDKYKEKYSKTYTQMAKEMNYDQMNFHSNLANLRKHNKAYKFRSRFADYLNLQNITIAELEKEGKGNV